MAKKWEENYGKLLCELTRDPYLSNKELAHRLGLLNKGETLKEEIQKACRKVSRDLRELRQAKIVGLSVNFFHDHFGLSERALVLFKVDVRALRNHRLGFNADQGFASFLVDGLLQAEGFKEFKGLALINRAYIAEGNYDVAAVVYSKDAKVRTDLVTRIRDKIEAVTESMSITLVSNND